MSRTSRILTALALGVLVALLAIVAPRGTGSSGEYGGGSTAAQPPLQVGVIELVDYLPVGHVKDASVDYTAAVQAALDAAANNTLVLPPFPVLVSRAGAANWCLRATRPMTVRGSEGAELRERDGAVQILRFEAVDGLLLTDFTLRGVPADGQNLAHGLLQITGGSEVTVERVHVADSDADGIAVAGVDGVLVSGCSVRGVSKAGIYLSSCRRGRVVQNLVADFGGQVTAAGQVVGAGIQLSSNTDVLCSGNTVSDGTGSGILCNGLTSGTAPLGNVISGNLIERVSNPSNIDGSSGIRCANGCPDKVTQTLVAGNSIRSCGAYGLFIENHGSSFVTGNVIVASDRSGLVVSTIERLLVAQNAVYGSGQAQSGPGYGIHLINGARSVTTRGNAIDGLEPGASFEASTYYDASYGGGHDLEPRILHGPAPPTTGHWPRGSLVYDDQPVAGGHVGWVCIQAGQPGTWAAFGAIE